MGDTKPFTRALYVTRIEAASRQIEAAIDAFEIGSFDVAVTLACAAEGMAPPNPKGLFKLMMQSPRWGDLTEKNRSSKVNLTRDWLKHRAEDKPGRLLIEEAEAAYCIVRAMSVWEPWTPKIDAFGHQFLQALGKPRTGPHSANS
ncbi:hypothetical protein [Mesorhizobium sp. SP-1A]|uniref:hypothetical protein n=1 Tax=Mesorhizobium sp. SP-1A TaxID=3077840 RepID=UPI0028F71BF9|nr:hypothetical protein [Mesorhizobium sp. SP-1A]